jgi:RNA polymerase sigma factor (sigma-70 family)
MSHRLLAAFRALRADAGPTPDAELLAAVLAGADEAAFEELVRRHGPMVLRVCRDVLGHRQDAEDAFQATFVVLLRRAATIGSPDSLASWLHGVAVRVSRELLANRRRHAAGLLECEPIGPADHCPVERAEVAAILHCELAGLPPLYRAPVVLCELQGRSRREAAGELGIREGTLSSRLAKAKRLLAERLAGKIPAAVILSAMLAAQAAASPVTVALACRTVRLLVGVSLGDPAGGTGPTAVHLIAIGVTTAMRASNLRGALVAALLLVGFAGLVAAWPAPRSAPLPPTGPLPMFTAAPAPAEPKAENRIWVRYPKTGKLVALTAVGRPAREIALKDGPLILRVAPAANRLWFAAQEGRSPEVGANGRWPEGKLTLHARAITDKTTGDDSGIEVTDQSVITPDGKTLGVVVMKQTARVDQPNAQPFIFENALIDVATKKVTKLDLPGSHQLYDLARDGSWVLTLEYNLPDGEKGTPPYRLHKVPTGGGKPRLLSGTLSTAYPGSISPDGTRVLTFAEDLKGKDEAIWELSAYVIDVGTGKANRIAGEKKQLWSSGVWSPDGKRIAYAWRAKGDDGKQVDANGVPPTRLVVCDADGKNAATILTEDEDFIPVAWW